MAAAGTLTLTQNSTTVTGKGTAFTTALAAGGFIVATVGGTAYTLGITSIESNTSLTLSVAYNGPTSSGVAFDYVPLATLNLITSALAAQVTYALRAANLDRNNWQQIFSSTGNVTVTLPDGTSWTGPAWNSITTSLAGKVDKAQNLNDLAGKVDKAQNLNDLADKGTAWNNIAKYGTTATTAARGDDSRLNSIESKEGGTLALGGSLTAISRTFSDISIGQHLDAPVIRSILNGRGSTLDVRGAFFGFYSSELIGTTGKGVMIYSGFNSNKYWEYLQNGNATAQGSWINASDERHKFNIQIVPNALQAVLSWRGATYDKKDGVPDVGLIAQDIEKSCPIAVTNVGKKEFSDGTVIDDFKALNTPGVAAAYHTEAIKALFNLVELALADPEKALASIDAIKESLVSE